MTENGRHTIVWHQMRGPDSAGVVLLHHSQKDMEPHDHLFHEVVFVVEGTGVHHSAAGRESIRPGSIVVLRPQVWHAYERCQGLKIINCLLDSRLITRFGPLLSQVPHAFELYRKRASRAHDDPPTMLHARPAQFRPILDRLSMIDQELKQRRDGWQASAILGAMDVLVSCARLGGEREAEAQPAQSMENLSRAHQAVLETVAYIESNYAKAITLETLAQRVHLSPAHLSRSFTRYMGCHVVSFIHRLRVEEACRLLRASNLPVTDVASMVGYEEIAYFSRCFRQQIGLSPRAYRQTDTPRAASACQAVRQARCLEDVAMT